MGLQRVGHDLVTEQQQFISTNPKLWRRKWQPTPVFLPGESQGWGSLVGCRLWGRTESDTTEVTQQQQSQTTNLSLPHLPSLVTIILLSMSMSLFPFCKVHLYLFPLIPHISDIT